MNIYRLMYISTGRKIFGTDELREFVDVCIKNNAEINVTGMLLYVNGNFLQLLEGRQEDVKALFYDRIALDKRHSGAFVLWQSEVSERVFPDWAMGLKTVDPEKNDDIAGLFKLSHGELKEKIHNVSDARAEEMIEMFMEVNA